MRYKGFYIGIKSGIVQRKTPDGGQTDRDGFMIQIFDSPAETVIIDMFTAAVGYELLENSMSEAEQLAKDYIDSEEKELCRMIEEYQSFDE